MNFSVITNADSGVGGMIAVELARHKKNLILLGKCKMQLEELKRLIRLHHSVHIHFFEFAQTSRTGIMELCGYINDHFFVESLIEVVLDDHNKKWTEQMTRELNQQLPEKLLLPLLTIHQLLPNLMLCAEATWVRVIKKEFGLNFETYTFSETGSLLKAKMSVSIHNLAVGGERKCSLADIVSGISIC
jgi:short-subunit dehydrogenase